MISGKKGYLRPSIRMVVGKESGTIEPVCGLFFLLFIFLLLVAHLDLMSYETSVLYTEDALAASNLASAVIDIEEYGISHNVVVKDYLKAYERFEDALCHNLSLDEGRHCRNRELIEGKVLVEKYIVYNVQGNRVDGFFRGQEGNWHRESGNLGEVYAPNGQLILHTGIFSEISYGVSGIAGIYTDAVCSKLVDIAAICGEDVAN